MADNNVKVESRFMKYNKAEVDDLLDKVHNADTEPTEGSANMISSGAVSEALSNMASIGEKVDEVIDEESEEDSGE